MYYSFWSQTADPINKVKYDCPVILKSTSLVFQLKYVKVSTTALACLFSP